MLLTTLKQTAAQATLYVPKAAITCLQKGKEALMRGRQEEAMLSSNATEGARDWKTVRHVGSPEQPPV